MDFSEKLPTENFFSPPIASTPLPVPLRSKELTKKVNGVASNSLNGKAAINSTDNQIATTNRTEKTIVPKLPLQENALTSKAVEGAKKRRKVKIKQSKSSESSTKTVKIELAKEDSSEEDLKAVKKFVKLSENEMKKGKISPQRKELIKKMSFEARSLSSPRLSVTKVSESQNQEFKAHISGDHLQIYNILYTFKKLLFPNVDRSLDENLGIINLFMDTKDKNGFTNLKFAFPYLNQLKKLVAYLQFDFREVILKENDPDIVLKTKVKVLQDSLYNSTFCQEAKNEEIRMKRYDDLLRQTETFLQNTIEKELVPYINKEIDKELEKRNLTSEAIEEKLNAIMNDTIQIAEQAKNYSHELERPFIGSYLKVTRSEEEELTPRSFIHYVSLENSLVKIQTNYFSSTTPAECLSTITHRDNLVRIIHYPFKSQARIDSEEYGEDLRDYIKLFLQKICEELNLHIDSQKKILSYLDVKQHDISFIDDKDNVIEDLNHLQKDLVKKNEDFQVQEKKSKGIGFPKALKRVISQKNNRDDEYKKLEKPEKNTFTNDFTQEERNIIYFFNVFNQGFVKHPITIIYAAYNELFGKFLRINAAREWEESQSRSLQINFGKNDVTVIVERLGFIEGFPRLLVSQIVELTAEKAKLNKWQTEVIYVINKPKEMSTEESQMFEEFLSVIRYVGLQTKIVET